MFSEVPKPPPLERRQLVVECPWQEARRISEGCERAVHERSMSEPKAVAQNGASGREPSPKALYSRNDLRTALCRAQDARSFASGAWRQEHDCAVASPSTADRLHCLHIDTRPRKFREDVSDSTGPVVAVNVKRRTFAQPKLGLLCGGDKGSTILWYKLELRPPFSVGISPAGDEIDSRIAECTQNACSFADLVSDGRCVVFDLPNLCHEASFRRTCLHCKPCAEDRCVQKDEVGQLSLNPERRRHWIPEGKTT